MKILLVAPHYEEIYKQFKSIATVYPPLGLAYLGAVLEKANHKVRIIDMPAENITTRDYHRVLEDFQPSIVGFYVLTPTTDYCHKLAEITKTKLNNVSVIFGGIHPTILPSEELRDEYVDIVVRGEGEENIIDLIDTLENKGDLRNVLGISYKKDGEVIHNPARPLIKNLDELPFPARHLLHGKYFFVEAKKQPLDVILSARGCPYRCIFCNRISGRSFRARSPTNVVDEMEYLVKTMGIREIHMIDDIFNLHLRRAKDICDEIIHRELEVTWALPSGIRANEKHFDEELAEKLHASGCWHVAFGIESGDQSILDGIKKDLKLEEVRRAVRLCRKAGIEEIWGFFILGLPEDTEKTVQKTIEFACELDLDVAKFHILTPYPGTEVYDMFENQKLIRTKDWPRYGIHVDPVYDLITISKDRLLELHRQAYRTFYFRRAILLKMIRRMIISPRRGWNMFRAGYSIARYSV